MFNSMRRLQLTVLSLLAAAPLPLGAIAAENENPALVQVQQMPSMAGYFFRVLVSLLIILVLTYLVIRVIKKQQEIGQRMERTGKDWIRVFDYYNLGVNRGIYLAQIFSAVYIIAVSDNHLSILKEIDPSDEEWQSIRENLEKQKEIIPSGWLKRLTASLKGSRREDFKTVLDHNLNSQISGQLDRTRRLYRQIKRGGQDGE